MIPAHVEGIGCRHFIQVAVQPFTVERSLWHSDRRLQESQIPDTGRTPVPFYLVDMNPDNIGQLQEPGLHRLIGQLLQRLFMTSVNLLQRLGYQVRLAIVADRRDYQVLPVSHYFQRGIHVDVQNLQQRFVDNQGGAVAVGREGFYNGLLACIYNVYPLYHNISTADAMLRL